MSLGHDVADIAEQPVLTDEKPGSIVQKLVLLKRLLFDHWLYIRGEKHGYIKCTLQWGQWPQH
jgi:hypothetical protein